MNATAFPVQPMKATLGTLPTGDDWAFEIKWDGYRTLAHVDGDSVRLQSSAGHDVTARWPELTAIASAINATSTILDAELVVLDDTGQPRFDLVQRSGVGTEREAVLYLFDVVAVDGTATVDLPYEARRSLLEQLVEPGSNWMVPAHRLGDGAALLEATAAQSLEGVVAKKLGSRYEIGKRSKVWRKVKNRRRVTLTVVGMTAGSGRRASTFASLLLAKRDDEGLRFAGAVGTGFDQDTLERLHTLFGGLAVPDNPLDAPLPTSYRATTTWVTPTVDVELEIAEFTNDGHVRHASFVGLANSAAS